MSTRLCAEPWCTELVDAPARRCPTHTTRGHTSGTPGYGGRQWRNTSRAYLHTHPTCEQPGCTAPATEVHHRDGRHPLDPGANDWRNLQALCHPHHSRATAKQQRGKRLALAS